MKEPKPLTPSLARLVRAERHADGPPRGAEERAWERLERSIGGGGFDEGGPDGAENRVSGAMLRPRKRLGRVGRVCAVLAIFALGIVVGALGMHMFDAAKTAAPPATQIVYVDRAAPSPSAVTAAPSATVALEIPDEGAPQAPSPSAAALPTSRQLAGERPLLDIARAALNRGEGEEALRATDRHKSRFPSGLLAEEREALSIQALLLLNRTDDAKRRAIRFQQRYPRSVLLPAIQAAVASAP
ncbi:hypothetical protein LZC95_53275 [Pendulispora brunnea]|uniref:Uncharacterized protein n=1 Tax=Pendulispora brunnea TaxID=2905690 RepID=A0ABZ2KCK2_9BACT